jgi:hypothetical protein
LGEAINLHLLARSLAVMDLNIAVDPLGLGPLHALWLDTLNALRPVRLGLNPFDMIRADALGALGLHGHALHPRRLHTLSLTLDARRRLALHTLRLALHALRLRALNAFGALGASTMATGARGGRGGNRHRGHARGQI